MDFELHHPIAAGLSTVETALFDSAALERMSASLDRIDDVRIVRLEREGTSMFRSLRMRPSALPWFARRVPREMTEWTEHLVWDLGAHRGVYTVEPSVPPELRRHFDAHGTYVLEALDHGNTIRRVTGAVVIRSERLVDVLLERVVVQLVKKFYRDEARWLNTVATSLASAAPVPVST